MRESLNLIIWIYAVAALASSVAAVLAWASKLWWAKEYASAKNETIRAKEAEIELLKTELENLRQFTPMKLREYSLSVKEQLEEYNEQLKQQLATAHEELKEKDSEISKLLQSYPGLFPGGPERPELQKLAVVVEAQLRELEATKAQLQAKANSLEQRLKREEELRQNFDQLWSWFNKSEKEARS